MACPDNLRHFMLLVLLRMVIRALPRVQMREEFGNIVPSCRRPVKAAPPTPVSTVSVARSRGIGGRHASPICRRPVSPLAAAGCDGRVVSEAHRARQAGVEGAVGAAAIAATTDAGSEAPDGMSRPDCIEAGKAEGADSSLTLADGGGNVLRTGSGEVRRVHRRVETADGRCSHPALLYSALFHSILLCYILLYSVLLRSVLFYYVLFVMCVRSRAKFMVTRP